MSDSEEKSTDKEQPRDAGAGKGDVYRPTAREKSKVYYHSLCKKYGHKFNGRRCRNCGLFKD